MEQLVMNRKERQRLVVLSRVKDKQWSRRQGAEILGLTARRCSSIASAPVASTLT
jgi:hypothetical protein